MKLPAVFERYSAEINIDLKSVLAERQSPLYDMMRYHFGWLDDNGKPRQSSAGKALRPILCLLACEAVGGEYRRALPAAAAVELIHNFSLIHDDIQDDDRERRHRPTVWSIWGKPQGINAGTAMRILASLALSRLRDHDVSVPKQLRAQQIIDESSLRLVEGQYLDISYESRLDIKVNGYLDMIERKTAALVTSSLEIGALLGTDDERMIESFRDIGRNLGLAFQIKDDILGIWGDSKETGKSLGSDIRNRKKTLPIVLALEKVEDGPRRELVNIYRDGMLSEDGVSTVLRILKTVDAQANAQKMTERYCDQARQVIDKLALVSSARRDFEELLHFWVERSF